MTSAEYNACVDLHADGLYRFILKNTRDEDKAKDIVQDTFEKVWRKKSDISFQKAKSYLFTAGYHTMIYVLRKDQRQESLGEEDPVGYAHERQYSDLQEVLHEALGRLPETQRSVVLLRDYEGYTYEEIGEITGLSEAQVKVYIFRARTYLKNYIGTMDAVI